jgi:transcription elongation factor Elf1
MLNRTANLALCSNCGAQMVPEFTKVAKRKKYVENKHPQPFSCDKCGNTNVSVLTHLGKRGNWCYNCLKDKTADETWTKKKISNA